ncbi:MAG: hypothetical protein WAN93_03275 [Solirubrobacteraceae bacterium]
MSSRRNRPFAGVRPTVLAALLGLSLLVAGCGSSGSAGTASQTTAAGSGSSTASAQSSSTAPKGSSTSHAAQAPAKSTKAPATGAPKVASSQAGGRLLQQFIGSGDKRLGTIAVSSSQVLLWSAQHPPIQIFTSHGFIVVSSHAPSGSVLLSRGSYPGIRVASRGRWSIELRARS